MDWTSGLHPLAAEIGTDGAPVARRSWKRHKAILEAAIACVARSGYAATTVEAVAAEAGAGKQTIYRWWPSKAALFVEVYARLADRSALDGTEDNSGTGTAEDRLAAMLRRLFALYRDTPAGIVLAGLIGEAASNPDVRDAVRHGLVLGRGDIVRRLVKNDPVDPDIVHDLVVALVWKGLILEPMGFTDDLARDISRQAVTAGRFTE